MAIAEKGKTIDAAHDTVKILAKFLHFLFLRWSQNTAQSREGG